MASALQGLLHEGAEAMAAHRYEDAVEIYSEACQVANLETGKDDPDLMFLYGKALFENGRASNDVLGGVNKGKNNSDKLAGEEDEEQEQEGEEEVDANAGKTSNGDNNSGAFQFNDKLAEEEEEEEEEKEGEGDKAGDKSSDEEVEETEELGEKGDNEGEGEDEGEEQSDFEIAWEILELARVLYQERIDEEADANADLAKPYKENEKGHEKYVDAIVRLADVHMLMGDISLETENFVQSVEDFKKGVELVEAAFGRSSGRYREAKFKLSLAHEFVGDEDNMSAAIECMEDVLNNLQTTTPIDTELIEDVEGRLSELRETVKERAAEKEQIVGMLRGVVSEVKREAANDLTGLVKRKKK